jgi:uncharacterized protein with PIN domain
MPTGGTKLVADAMLGSLCRKLRAFGFDTAYYRRGGDEGIVRLARDEGRVILTSDRALQLRAARVVPALLVTGSTDGRRIRSLLSAADSAGIRIRRGKPLCSVCNGSLAAITRNEAAAWVPDSVLRRHRLFLRCECCGRTYWRGGHWKKLSNLERAFGHRERPAKVTMV